MSEAIENMRGLLYASRTNCKGGEMSEKFVIEYEGKAYDISPTMRTPFLESMMDHHSSGREKDDFDHVYSALDFPPNDTPMVELLLDSINGIPPKEFDWGNNELQYVICFTILARMYDDTDLADSVDRFLHPISVLKPAFDRVQEKLQRGELHMESTSITFKPVIDEALNMPDVMQKLRALGEHCPEWAK